jgi:hypothetical protein
VYPLRSIHSHSPSSSTEAYSGPCRSSADAVITTSAPASRYLISSVEPSTPVVAASDAPIRPCSNVIHVSGSRASAARDNDVPGATASVSGSMSGCRNRLNSTSPSAPARSRRRAISAVALKYGLSFTATGTVTASLTRARMSRWRCSTSRPETCGSPGR